LEACVRDLAAAWNADPDFAKRTVRLLRDECVRIPRRWLDGTPPEMSKALAAVIAD
jgi:hypothetical protein